MLALAAARAEGLTWRAAMVRCRLERPDEIEVSHQARILRGQLRELWNDFEGLLGPLQVVTATAPVAYANLIEHLRRFLT